MITVSPSDQVGRLPIRTANLEDDAMTIRLACPMPSNHDVVTNFCEHHTPPAYARSPTVYHAGRTGTRERGPSSGPSDLATGTVYLSTWPHPHSWG